MSWRQVMKKKASKIARGKRAKNAVFKGSKELEKSSLLLAWFALDTRSHDRVSSHAEGSLATNLFVSPVSCERFFPESPLKSIAKHPGTLGDRYTWGLHLAPVETSHRYVATQVRDLCICGLRKSLAGRLPLAKHPYPSNSMMARRNQATTGNTTLRRRPPRAF